MSHNYKRLENPSRIAELNPKNTLREIGLMQESVFCDIGAGSGIFTFAAAEITKNNIYAVDISEDMLTILRTKVNDLNLKNINIANSVEVVPSDSCDVVLLCTVFHELSDTEDIMKEVKRVLKNNGVLSIIEFYKRTTPMGPPVEERIDSNELQNILHAFGFKQKEHFSLGENFYCSIFDFSK